MASPLEVRSNYMGCLRVPSTTYRILGTVYRGYRIFSPLSASESAARKSSLNITSGRQNGSCGSAVLLP